MCVRRAKRVRLCSEKPEELFQRGSVRPLPVRGSRGLGAPRFGSPQNVRAVASTGVLGRGHRSNHPVKRRLGSGLVDAGADLVSEGVVGECFLAECFDEFLEGDAAESELVGGVALPFGD